MCSSVASRERASDPKRARNGSCAINCHAALRLFLSSRQNFAQFGGDRAEKELRNMKFRVSFVVVVLAVSCLNCAHAALRKLIARPVIALMHFGL
jgi:hypothetical protein